MQNPNDTTIDNSQNQPVSKKKRMQEIEEEKQKQAKKSMQLLLEKIEDWLTKEEKLLVGKSIFMMNFFKSDINLKLFISLITQPITVQLGSFFKWTKYHKSRWETSEEPRIDILISQEQKIMRKAKKFAEIYEKNFRNYLRSYLA